MNCRKSYQGIVKFGGVRQTSVKGFSNRLFDLKGVVMVTKTKHDSKVKNPQFGKDRHPEQDWIDAIMKQQHCSADEAQQQITDAKATGMTLKGWLEFNRL